MDRVITIVKKNGDVITSTNKDRIVEAVKDNTQTNSESLSKITYLPHNYSLDLSYTPSFQNWAYPSIDIKNPDLTFGVRLAQTPLFITVGTDVKLDKISLGARIEF